MFGRFITSFGKILTMVKIYTFGLDKGHSWGYHGTMPYSSTKKERPVFILYNWIEGQQAKHFERNPIREWIWYRLLVTVRWLCNVTSPKI
jgi:hypothetical protein